MICLTDICLDIFIKCGIFNYDCSNMVQGQFHEIWPSRTNNMTHVTLKDNPMNRFSRKTFFCLTFVSDPNLDLKFWTKNWTNNSDTLFRTEICRKYWLKALTENCGPNVLVHGTARFTCWDGSISDWWNNDIWIIDFGLGIHWVWWNIFGLKFSF